MILFLLVVALIALPIILGCFAVRAMNDDHVPASRVECDDPNMAEVVARAFNTGKPVVGNVDEDGVLHIRELDDT